jgi:hypothetical protein
MPVSYELDPEREIILTRIFGTLTLDEIRDHIDDLLADPALPPRLYVLLDAMALTSAPSTETVRGCSEQIERLRDRVRLEAVSAAVAGMVYYGVFRMSQVLLERHFGPTHVCMDLDSAREWLTAQRAASA